MLIDKINIWQVQFLFTKIVTRADLLTNLFFEKLFEFEPDLKLQLNYDRNNSEKYFCFLQEIIMNLGDPAKLMSLIHSVIEKMNELELNDSIYLSTGKAMLWALTKILGTNFNFESRKAWISIYLSIKQEIEMQCEVNRSV